MVRMLKKEFPDSNFIANGGLASVNDCMKLFKSISLDTTYPKVDGVMLGRSVIKKPLLLRDLSQSLENDDVKKVPTLEEIMINLNSYFIKRESEGVPAARITRQWHGLFSKLTGARKWRRLLSSGYKPLDAYNEAFR